ncbi:uncharacterized protein [Montipora capricornis]|uniref:uncharacterized protein n=1 Tax=Montipora capricornis TaxID=246305 RepID=UPI0035F20996
MKYFLGILCLALLAAKVRAQICVEETLDCNQPVPTIFKLGDASCHCNDAAHAGSIRYANGKVQVCLGTEWKTVQYTSAYGTERNPGYSCKDILDNSAGQQLNDGVYWIRLRGHLDGFPVYCQMTTGGWTMVFKIASGVNKVVWDVYRSTTTSAEFVTAALDVTNQHQDHYKNRVVLNWDNFNATQARVSVYKGGVVQKELLFNAQGTDNLNWFSAGKLISSSWPNIKTESTNFFGIQGDCHDDDGACRSFFINKSYDGCNSDYGWIVGATSNIWCSWETSATNQYNVLYSKTTSYTNWNTAANVGVADAMVVLLK